MKTLLMLISLTLPFVATGQEYSASPAELLRIEYVSKADKSAREYYLYLPAGYRDNNERKWPVMVFLHGNGERGNGTTELDWVFNHGPLYEAWIQKRDLPFIIIAPQLAMMGMDSISYIKNRNSAMIPQRLPQGVPPRFTEDVTTNEMNGIASSSNFPYKMLPSGWEVVADDILDMVQYSTSSVRGDDAQVYLTGLSYGGFGTWYLGSRFPQVWAGLVPIAGWGHPEFMDQIARQKIGVWAFAGGRDPVIKVEHFYPGINALEKLGHKDVQFTVHEDMGHDVWKRVYAGEDVYSWMLNHRKP